MDSQGVQFSSRIENQEDSKSYHMLRKQQHLHKLLQSAACLSHIPSISVNQAINNSATMCTTVVLTLSCD